MTRITFAKGDKIKCINAKHASGGLTEGEVYTAKKDSYIADGWSEAVPVEEIPGWSFQVDRFEKVEPVVIINESGPFETPEVTKNMVAWIRENPDGEWILAIAQGNAWHYLLATNERITGSISPLSAARDVITIPRPGNGPKIVEDPAVADAVGPNVAGIVIGPEGIQLNGILIQADPADDEIKPGSWVYVVGQVLESMEGDEMDHLVEFFSHNEQWKGWVRKDRVIPTFTPDFVGQCTAMTVNVLDTNIYYRCEKREHRRFDKNHKSGDFEWVDGDTSGYVEEA